MLFKELPNLVVLFVFIIFYTINIVNDTIRQVLNLES